MALVAASWAIALSAPAVGADEGWVITSFHSNIEVAANSTLTITEDIRVDFQGQQKHGIFRTIPARYRYDDSRDRYYGFELKSVTDGTRSLMYEWTAENYDQVIKIGDPNLLVSGTQRYVITYQVAGAMNSFADHDELFWNIDGALWPVPKQSVHATVNLPAGAYQKATCYQGPVGSTEACTAENSANSVAFKSTRQLGSGEEMSAVVGLNKGVVNVPPPLLEPRLRQFPEDAFDINGLTVAAALLVLVLGLGLVAWNWWAHGRDRAYLTQYYLTKDPSEHAEPLFAHEPLVVEFEPPQKMRPAELGLILDESADAKDVTATIVDLGVRGHLTITELPEWADWKFAWKAGPAEELLPYEKTILDGIFAGRKEVRLSELEGDFRPQLTIAESQIYSDALSRRLFTHSPRQARAAWGCAGIAVVIIGCALAVGLGIAGGWGLVGVAVVITGIVLTASFPFMPQRTAAGRDLMQHTLGFRLYMTTAEKYRQQFAAKADIFTALLPYAIVFGCVSLWAKAFEGIDTTTSNSWYVGTGPFQAALLANNLESMNTSISSAISYTPRSAGSSSGFGGGGFSGGGGGGGGGGSW